MLSQFGKYLGHHSDTVMCPKCGNLGTVTWDEVATLRGRERELAGISGNFYERLCKRDPYPIELVCNTCEIPCASLTVQPSVNL